MRVSFWANTRTQAVLARSAAAAGLTPHQVAKRIVDEWAERVERTPNPS